MLGKHLNSPLGPFAMLSDVQECARFRRNRISGNATGAASESSTSLGTSSVMDDSQINESFRTVFSRTGSAQVLSPTPVIAMQQVQDIPAAAPSVAGSDFSFCTATSHCCRLTSQQLDELESTFQVT